MAMIDQKIGTCADCRYYDAKSGECRESSPDSHGLWPPVKSDRWCGDWWPNEKLQQIQGQSNVQAQQAVADR